MYNRKFILIFLPVVFAWFFANLTTASALEIQSLRFGQHGAALRVVMDLSAEADFRATVQDAPPRIVIDLPGVVGQPAIRRSQMPEIIRDIRLEPLRGGYSRLTFMLEREALIRSAFLMPATNTQPVRLVIDTAPAPRDTFIKHVDKPYGTLALSAPGAGVAANPQGLPFAGSGGAKLDALSKPASPDAPDAPKVAAPATLPLVVIDAGHGGADPGASGAGVREKDVTLAVAKSLRTALEATGRYRVRLTRDRDVFIRLPERVNIARQAGADLFVSIHADSVATGHAGVAGASFYTLSDRASDEQTARLAARENQADLLAGVDLPEGDHEVAGILIDLTMRETTAQSKRFAGRLIDAFRKGDVPMLPGPHRHAGFMVLKAPDVPSVLIELGFLSNPEEVKKLADDAYRTRLGRAIAGGVDAWFAARKP